MPIFEYICSKCSLQFEKFVLGSRETNIECPGCKTTKINRILSDVGLKNENAFTSGAKAGGCGCNPMTCGCSRN